jgi:phytanoyl-CoA hydroxylase
LADNAHGLCSCWFPLDDATIENGCMGVLEGAHKQGSLPHVNVPNDFIIEDTHFNKTDIKFKPMKAGSGLFFHSLLPHYTAPNQSNDWRRSIALSYMNSESKFDREGDGPEYFHIQGKTFAGCVR